MRFFPLLLLFLSSTLLSQISQDVFKKKDEKLFEKANRLLINRQPEEALKIYSKIEKDYSDNRLLLLKIATAHLELQNDDLSITYLEKIAATGYNQEPRVYSTLGGLYKRKGLYQLALDNYQVFLSIVTHDSALKEKALLEIQQLVFILEARANSEDIILHPLPDAINTSDSEYLPQFSIDGKRIIFTRRYHHQEDIFEASNSDSAIVVTPIDRINTRLNEGAHCISADGKTLIFTHCNDKIGYGSCDLYESQKTITGWSSPRNLGSMVNSRSWDSQPSLSVDGQTLYFISNRKGSQGGKDIWISSKVDGQWTLPKNLSALNTAGNEESPFIHADNKTLFYRSNALLGMGGYDIYMSRKATDDWGHPIHLGVPINTPGNDGALVVSLDGTRGFLATDNYLGKNLGHLDIFEFVLPSKYRPQPMTFMKGRITDGLTLFPIRAVIEVIDLHSSESISSSKCDINGEFLIAIPVKERLLINIHSEGYLFYSDHIEYDSVRYQVAPFVKNIRLSRLPADTDIVNEIKQEPIVLNNIFFESDKSVLLPESMTEIKYLFQLLVDNPSLSIEIVGHTDDIGSEEDNLLLSRMRADAVRQELLNFGIGPQRVQARGLGESFPVDTNKTPEGRAKNRRTEFIIIK